MLKRRHGTQNLINAQCDVNRAVWASNLQELPLQLFKNEDELDQYIINRAKDAIEDLTLFLKETENLLF